jgi:hypothetical protein
VWLGLAKVTAEPRFALSLEKKKFCCTRIKDHTTLFTSIPHSSFDTLMSSSLSGPSNFADDGSAVISRQIEVHRSKLASQAQDKINACSDIYEIERTVGAIKERGYKRVMLLSCCCIKGENIYAMSCWSLTQCFVCVLLT